MAQKTNKIALNFFERAFKPGAESYGVAPRKNVFFGLKGLFLVLSGDGFFSSPGHRAWGGACCHPLFRYPQLTEAQLIGSNDLNDLSD